MFLSLRPLKNDPLSFRDNQLSFNTNEGILQSPADFLQDGSLQLVDVKENSESLWSDYQIDLL